MLKAFSILKATPMMKINRKFQAQHEPEGSIDWVALQSVERDICLLYRQLAEYSYIMGDLYYGSVYSYPYWKYLDVSDVDDADRSFLREGCLVMILAMAWDMIDGSGAYLAPHIAECRQALEALSATDQRTSKLVRTVRQALDDAKQGAASEQIAELSLWVHEEFVKGYFRRVASEFDSNPYYRGDPLTNT